MNINFNETVTTEHVPRLTDGNKNMGEPRGCLFTVRESTPWVVIDLQRSAYIEYFQVYSFWDDKLKPLDYVKFGYVLLGVGKDVHDVSTACAEYEHLLNSMKSIKLICGKSTDRYVYLRKRNIGLSVLLGLCEFEVYGRWKIGKNF